MKILLYPHGGSGNHGCEAIVRSTVHITHSDATLYSTRVEEDFRYGLSDICNLREDTSPLNYFTLRFVSAWFRNHFLGDTFAFDKALYSPEISSCCNYDYAFSIGGDNYCYGIPHFIYLLNREFRKRNVKTILWGCSVDPDLIHGELLDDLKGYVRIVARESITYSSMVSNGLTNVCLFPDPAFTLDSKDVDLPLGFKENDTVGINVSPLIIEREYKKGMIMNNYYNLIDYIIHNTKMQVALIPHVVWDHNDDREPLSRLFSFFEKTGRIIMIEDQSCEALKGIIARCRFMVAARTHASIAAYSTQVPTLVLGYSVKSRGIAQDLFGSDDHYVIPVQSINNPNVLIDEFRWLMDHEIEIRNHYSFIMPSYVEWAWQAGEILTGI